MANNRKKLNKVLRERNRLRSVHGHMGGATPQQELNRLQNQRPMTERERMAHIFGFNPNLDPILKDLLG